MSETQPVVGGSQGAAAPRWWQLRVLPWIAGLAGALAGVLVACDSLTNPGDDSEIVITYDHDSTVVVGSIILPRFTVTVDGQVASSPRLALSSSDPSVISVSTSGDSLYVLSRGFSTISATLIGSTISEDPPTGSRVLHAVIAELHIGGTGIALDALGDTVTCTAVALGATGDTLPGVRASWYSADESVASVNASGRVTAIRNGSTEIFAVVDYDTASAPVAVAQKLAGFSFEPAPVVLNSLGATAQLTATPRDKGDNEIPSGDAPDPNWSTADPGIATVTSEGLATAVANGETYIRASGPDAVDSVRTEVRQVAVRVSIFGPDSVLLDAIDDEVRLSAAGFDALDTDVLVTRPTWVSRNLGVAQVDPSSGIVRALGLGTATIVARVDTAADSVTVTVRNLPTSLDVVPDTLRFASIGDTIVAQAKVRNKFDSLLTDISTQWATVDTAVATVASDGRVVAKAIGTTRLIGTLTNGIADTTLVIVENLPVTVDIIPLEVTLASVADIDTIAVDIRNSRGAPLAPSSVTWSSDDAVVVTTSASGVITARSRGEAYVRTTNPYNAAQRDSVLVHVTNAPALVTLNRTLDTVTAVTRTLEYQAVVENARGATIPGDEEQVDWRSLDVRVATVNSAGLATATGVGTTQIVASVGSGATLKADSATLTVLNTVVSVRISPNELAIPSVGDTAQLSVTALNDVGGEVTSVQFSWTSSDTAVADVSPAGVVTSKQVGTTTVTVRHGSLSASASITVTNAPYTVEIIPDNCTLASIRDTCTPEVNFRNALDSVLDRSSAEWLSEDALVATVNSDGIITATGRGTTRIRARNPLNYSRTDLIEVIVTNAPDSIELNRTDDVLPSLDRTLQYDATVWNARDDIIADAAVTWTSLNTAVATITASGGLARSVGIGETFIVGQSGSVADTARLVVANRASQVTVSPSPVTFTSTGSTQPLTVVALNELGNEIEDPSVTCLSTNTSVATVDGDCIVTAVSVGNASIAVTVDDITVTVAVSISNHPATVEITPTSYTLAYIGETYLVAPVEFRNAQGVLLERDAVNWSTSNPSIATVSDVGLVTAVGRGTATIRATSPAASNITDALAVTVTNAPTSVTLDTLGQGNVTLTAYGETLTYGAEVRNVNGDLISNEPLTWLSFDNSVATITQGGIATAVGRGTTTITAECTNYPSISSTPVTLEVTNDAVSISVSPTTVTILDLEGTYQLSAVALNNRGDALVEPGDITWSSLNENVATVTTTGRVTATDNPANIGTVGIVATATYGGLTAQSNVSVHNAPRTVDITSPNTTLDFVGASFTVAATIQNLAGADLPRTAVSWSSSATNIATVDEDGDVTARAPGSTVIRATSPFDLSLTDAITVTVNNDPDTLRLNTATVSISALLNTYTLEATVVNAAGAVVTGHTILWSSDDPTIATVAGGVVTAVGEGSTQIHAVVDGFPTVGDAAGVTVTNVARDVLIQPSAVDMTSIGESVTVTATAYNSRGDIIANPSVTWSIVGTTGVFSTSATTGESIDITAEGGGQSRLRATVGDVTDTIWVTVTLDDAAGAQTDGDR